MSTIAASVAVSAPWEPSTRAVFQFSDGSYIALWWDGTNLVYSTSADNTTWSATTAIRAHGQYFNFALDPAGTALGGLVCDTTTGTFPLVITRASGACTVVLGANVQAVAAPGGFASVSACWDATNSLFHTSVCYFNSTTSLPQTSLFAFGAGLTAGAGASYSYTGTAISAGYGVAGVYAGGTLYLAGNGSVYTVAVTAGASGPYGTPSAGAVVRVSGGSGNGISAALDSTSGTARPWFVISDDQHSFLDSWSFDGTTWTATVLQSGGANIGATKGATVLVDGNDLWVFYELTSAQANGEIYRLRRLSGTWEATATLVAGGASTGFHLPAVSNSQSSGTLLLAWFTANASPIAIVDTSYSLSAGLNTPTLSNGTVAYNSVPLNVGNIGGGTSPYTVRAHRSLTNGFTPSGTTAGTGTCIAVHTGLSGTTDSYTDTSPTAGTNNYYVAELVDSASGDTFSIQLTVAVPAAPVAATGYTFTGPSSGGINAAQTFTVQPNGYLSVNETVTLTPSGTASTGLAPVTLTFVANGTNTPAAQTASFTPTVTGTLTVTPTNSAGWSNQAAINDTITSAPFAAGSLTPTINGTVVSLAIGAASNASGIVSYQVQRSATSATSGFSNLFSPLPATAGTAPAGVTDEPGNGTWYYRVVETNGDSTQATTAATSGQVISGASTTLTTQDLWNIRAALLVNPQWPISTDSTDGVDLSVRAVGAVQTSVWSNTTRTLTSGGSSGPTAAQIATAIWQDLVASTDFQTAGSIGLELAALLSKVSFDASNNVNAHVVSNGDKTGYSATVSGNVTVGGYATGEDPASLVLATPANKLTTDAAGKVGANNLPADYQQRGVAVTLPSSVVPSADQAAITATLLATAVSSTPTRGTVADALLAAEAQGFGKWTISGTTLTLYRHDGVTVARTFQLDSATPPRTRS